MKKKYNILLFGNSSYLNKGCEAIVATTTRNINKLNSGNKITVATFDKCNDENFHNDVVNKYINHRWSNDLPESERIKMEAGKEDLVSQRFVIDEIDKNDICMSIGGDNYCYGEPNWLYVIDDAVRDKNKKLILWGASINEDVMNERFISDIRKFDIVYVRESLTYKLLSKFVDNKKLILQPDTAFSLEAKKISLPKQFEENNGIVALNISPLIFNYKGESVDIIKSVQELIDYILEKYSYKIVLLPHVYIKGGNDLDTLNEIKKLYPNNDRIFVLDDRIYDCGELKYVISKCKFLIAARTHASIAGYSTQVPTLVLGYSIKSKGIAKDIFGEYENYVLPVEELSEKKLIEKFEYLVRNEIGIKDILIKKMPGYLEESKKIFQTVIDRMEENEDIDVTKKEKCSGCSSCANICPENAIRMIPDKEGFNYPFIDKNKCTNCGLCRKICPNNRTYSYEYPGLATYACKSLNNDERAKSSSGGLFSLLAKVVLKDKGAVFGAVYENYSVKHIKIDDESNLEKLRGSKYAESTIGTCYIDARQELNNGRKVLFSGVPCQIEGLKSFLGKDYPDLFCVSVVCHGVPSKEVFLRHLKELEEKYDDKIVRVNFRNKEESWKDFSIEYIFENKTIKRKIWTDEFMIGFLKDYYLRQSCYDCDYRLHKKNTADIILGDFWGIQNELSAFDDDRGVSVVVINSEKGKELLNKIQSNLESRNVTVEQIEKYNPSLIRPVSINEKRFDFFNLFNNNGVSFAVNYLKKESEFCVLENDLDKANKTLKEKENIINEKEIEIAEKENVIIEKNAELFVKDNLLNEISTTLNNINQSIIIYPILVLRNKIKKTLRQIKLTLIHLEQSAIYFGRNLLNEDIKKYLRPFLRKKYRVRVVDADNKKWKYPLVSIITPYYNRAHTINETIESILGQTFQDFEYIIVDDGSSDIESIKVFDEINNPKIRKIKQKNQGVASARNRGISEARGKYILCLDSDDTIDPTYLEKAISIMEMKPQYDIVYSNIKFFGLDDGVYCYESEFDVKKLIECNMLTTASVFKRKFWEKVSGYKTNLGFEDWEFWISLVEKGAQVKLIPEFLFNYRKAENSRYIEDIKKTEENTRKIRDFHPHYLRNIAKIARQDKIKYIFKDENKYINIENPKQYLGESGEMSKKSILFLMPWLTFGGAETVVYNLCSQIKEDFNISIITGLKSEHEWEYKFKETTNQIYHLANLFENSEEYFEFVVNYIKTRKIDVVHIIHNSIFYEMLPDLKSKFPDIKVVSTVFNIASNHFENSISCSNCIDMYTTDNSKVADAYKKGCSFGSEKIKVIHNGIDCNEKFNPTCYNRLSERKKMGINDGDVAVYFIGRLSPEKNPDVFVKAAGKIIKKHYKVKFFVIGDGPMRDEIKKSIDNIGNENIGYLGYQTDIPRYLSTADIFVLPSSIEGFPLSNVEAMSMGVCVISSNVGGVGDAIKDGETGFLMQPNSAEELANKIEFVISQKDILEKISKNARKSAEKNFSIEILADKYKKVYKSLYE